MLSACSASRSGSLAAALMAAMGLWVLAQAAGASRWNRSSVGGSHDQRRLYARSSSKGIRSSRFLRTRGVPSVTIRDSASSAVLGMCASGSPDARLTNSPFDAARAQTRHQLHASLAVLVKGDYADR